MAGILKMLALCAALPWFTGPACAQTPEGMWCTLNVTLILFFPQRITKTVCVYLYVCMCLCVWLRLWECSRFTLLFRLPKSVLIGSAKWQNLLIAWDQFGALAASLTVYVRKSSSKDGHCYVSVTTDKLYVLVSVGGCLSFVHLWRERWQQWLVFAFKLRVISYLAAYFVIFYFVIYIHVTHFGRNEHELGYDIT